MPPTADNPMTRAPIHPFWHWLRLTRPWNLLAMGVMSMVAMRWLGTDLRDLWHLGQSGWVVVPMLVGAAGNLINDYFDVREDRINKPTRALVGRLVKRRVVLVTHWGFSILALCWSGWLASSVDNSWPIVMVALFSVVLYFYSPLLKGNGASGNLAISGCVGGLVIWAALGCGSGNSWEAWTFAWLLFCLNFIREWVKDVQDQIGDRAAQHRTLAMRLTPRQNRIGVSVAMVLTGFMVVSWSVMMTTKLHFILAWVALFGIAVPNAFSENYTNLSAWLKVLIGVLFAFLL